MCDLYKILTQFMVSKLRSLQGYMEGVFKLSNTTVYIATLIGIQSTSIFQKVGLPYLHLECTHGLIKTIVINNQ